MLRVVPVRPEQRPRVPGITHVDGTTRPQTLTSEQAPSLHRLLSIFYDRTGVPMLLNTSLNVMGEPLVETPAEALACCRSTSVDWLVLGEQLISTSP
jgi:carbamoyltransferase